MLTRIRLSEDVTVRVRKGYGMGYNTHYSLKVELMIGSKVAELVDESPLSEVIKELREGNEEAAYVLDENGGSEEGGKWYEHETEMKEFSLAHPNLLFTLHGEGEENDDIWTKYFLNGKVQVARAQVQIAPFNFKELK